MKVLSIDGGGVFGIIPAYFLSQVDVSDFDVYCGTSVGSILALAYASGKSSNEMYELFRTNLKPVFGSTNFILFKGPKFKDIELNRMLSSTIIGNLGSLQKKMVVPAFDSKNNAPKVYDNFTGQDLDKNTWEVARESASAPSFFASWNGFIDGGIIANNPSLITIGALMTKLGLHHGDIELFSIGTGCKRSQFRHENINDWYRWQWLAPMLDMVTAGNEIATEFYVKLIPLKKYVRFNPVRIKNDWNFSDPECMDSCIDESRKFKDLFLQEYGGFFN